MAQSTEGQTVDVLHDVYAVSQRYKARVRARELAPRQPGRHRRQHVLEQLVS